MVSIGAMNKATMAMLWNKGRISHSLRDMLGAPYCPWGLMDCVTK